eukprot:162264_1
MSDAQEDPEAVPKWVVYAGVGLASYVAYKTLFKESKFVHEYRYEELKSDDYTANYPSGKTYYATNPWDTMTIQRSKRGPASWKPVRIFEMFDKCVASAPDSVLWKKEYLQSGSQTEYEWKTWTRQQTLDLTKQAARAFVACGLEQWQSVSIIGFNSPQWLIADLGAIYAGGIVAGIYTTNNAGQCKYIAAHSKSGVAVVENKKQLTKFLEIRHDLPDLKAIVIWDIDENDPIIASSNTNDDVATVFHWKEFMKLGSDTTTLSRLESECTKRRDSIKAGQCCTLIYTSGTTGPPKAVMISHDNITWQARAVLVSLQSFKKDGSPHATVSYLPLSHVAAQILDLFGPIAFTAFYPQCKSWEVYFARPTALKGTLALTLRAARPTILFGVPRVWEKIQEALIRKARETPASAPKQMLIDWLKSVCLQGYYARQLGGDMKRPFGYSLAEKILINKVKSALGLDRVQVTFTGAAPTSVATMEFWGSLGVDVLEVYGMSENCGVHTISLPYYNQIGTVGVPLDGVTTLLQNDPQRDSPGHGEICMRGRHIMMGYMYDEDKTRRAIDDEGYLHSGDVGTICDEYNVLKISGRIKELIITAGGENIAPVPIEDYLKTFCPAISNVVVIGDRKKYLVCLVTLKVKQDKDAMTYSQELEDIARDVDPECKTTQDAKKSEKWKQYIQKAVDNYNRDPNYCVSRAQRIQYFRILDGDFGVESGELTATMKLKRPIVAKKFQTARSEEH